MPDMEVLDYNTYGDAVLSLAHAVHDDGFKPDMILAIARGGLFVAASLGYSLGVKNLYVMNVEYYTGIDERLDVPLILPPSPELVDTMTQRVLIADDVADTGHTLATVKEFCEGKVAEVRTACIYEKPWSTVKCDYVWKHTDRWIDFPWSTKTALITPHFSD
jgi:uncharacterized protein